MLLTSQQQQGEQEDSEEVKQLKEDPTLPVIGHLSKPICTNNAQARSHGNEPSRGAKIDAQIKAEEEEELKRKGKA